MPIRRIVTLASIVCCLGVSESITTHADQSTILPQEMSELAASVVRIEVVRDGNLLTRGSGFVWRDTSTVVTALHVVACTKGANAIRVFYPQRQEVGYSSAEVSSVSTTHDLAIIKLSDPKTDVKVLEVATAENLTDGTTRNLIVAGYPAGSANLQGHDLKQLPIYSNTLNALLDSETKALLKNGSPSLDTKIIVVQGGLQPGYSGAPVFFHGKVVGIGDGGLGGGTRNIGWLMPAAALSKIVEPPTSASNQCGILSKAYFDFYEPSPQHEIILSKLSASVWTTFDGLNPPFTEYTKRMIGLYRNAVRAKDLQQLSKEFDEQAPYGIYTISQDSPTRFQTSPKSAKNNEYVDHAFLSTLGYSFACYSPLRLLQRLGETGSVSEPDLQFSTTVRANIDSSSSTNVRLRADIDGAEIEIAQTGNLVGKSATLRNGVNSARMLEGGGCLVHPTYSLPQGADGLKPQIDALLEKAELVLEWEPGAGATMKSSKMSLTPIGKLKEKRHALIVRFPRMVAE
ncbi:hypothetical protein CN311_16075 [Mesorhizobium sanjuanii]|uniref:Serine protease n=2 Tax=Mesorhizobium sanjuanii TaxID=2037900 RepID=A0A2A6FEC2_9HYPH|nr:hypothetical protein CN311_16075 [Mesorhizobium sanjuanii]